MLKGLLDTLNSEEGQLGLAMLAAAGPQAQPMSFGQRMAGVMQQQQARKQAEEDRKLKQLMTSLQMEDILSRRDDREMGRQRERAKQGYLGAIASGAEFSPAMALQYGLGEKEMAALAPKDDGFTLSPGQVRFRGNQSVASVPAAPEQEPSEIRALRLLQQNPELLAIQQGLKRAGATNVTVDQKGNNAFAEKGAQLLAGQFNDLAVQGQQARRMLPQIDRLDQLIQASGGGLQAVAKQAAGNFGIKTEGLDDIQAATAIINNLVPLQRPAGSGTMSDRDVELFKQSLPRLINSPEGNRKIIDTMRGIAQYDAEVGRIGADALAGRISREEADARIAKVPNPLANFNTAPKAGKKPVAEGMYGGRRVIKYEDGSISYAD